MNVVKVDSTSKAFYYFFESTQSFKQYVFNAFDMIWVYIGLNYTFVSARVIKCILIIKAAEYKSSYNIPGLVIAACSMKGESVLTWDTFT